MRPTRINLRSLSTIFVTVLALVGIGVIFLGFAGFAGLDIVPGTTQAEPVNVIPAAPPEPTVYSATIAAVGDLLIHMPITDSVKDPVTGGYDYNEVFGPVKPYVERADFSIANLETRMAGADMGYSGYPRFNTPDAFADSILWTGFDLVAMANNHSMDMGVDGIFNTLQTLDRVGLPAVGNYRTSEARDEPFLAEINGIYVAFLNYTEMTNGIPVPEQYPYACNVLDIETARNDIEDARDCGADFVIALLHFGDEYQRNQNSRQADIVRQLCEAGVDCVIGSHPHVVQRIEKITVNRFETPVECYVAYSLGNFISNQRDRYTDSGIILYLNLLKDNDGTRIDDIYFLPVYVLKASSGAGLSYRVLPVHPDIALNSDIAITSDDRSRMNQVWEELFTHLVKDSTSVHPLTINPEVPIDEGIVYF